jgi:hypothetical protein
MAPALPLRICSRLPAQFSTHKRPQAWLAAWDTPIGNSFRRDFLELLLGVGDESTYRIEDLLVVREEASLLCLVRVRLQDVVDALGLR